MKIRMWVTAKPENLYKRVIQQHLYETVANTYLKGHLYLRKNFGIK